MKFVLKIGKKYTISGSVRTMGGDVPYIESGLSILWLGSPYKTDEQTFSVSFEAREAALSLKSNTQAFMPPGPVIWAHVTLSEYEAKSTLNVGDDWPRKAEKEDPHAGQTYNAYNDTWHWF